MDELQIFNNPEFGQVRTLEEDGAVLFCGADVARALGYSKPQSAVDRHCPHALKRGIGVQTGKRADGTPAMQNVQMSFIPESDLYRLVFSSKLPSAERFTDWVTQEVLPSIRRHGAYMTPETLESAILNPDYLLEIVTALKQETDRRKALEAENAQLVPKALFADAVAASDTDILVGELAKLLRQNGVEIGEKRLFQRLRDDGYLIRRKGTDYNMPTQRAVEMGLFRIKETAITHSKGNVTISKTPKVTGKGQRYFLERYL